MNFMNCLRVLFLSYMWIINLAQAIFGLAVTSFGVFMMVRAASLTSNIVAVVGGVIFFLSIWGLLGVNWGSKCLLVPYILLMSLFCLGHAMMFLLLLVDPSMIIDHIPETNTENHLELRQWVTKNILIFVFVEAAVACAEFILIMCACCFVGDKREDSEEEDDMLAPLIGEPGVGNKRSYEKAGYCAAV